MSTTYALLFFLSGALLFQLLSKVLAIYHGVKLFYKLEKFVSIYSLFIDRTIDNYTQKHLEALILTEEEREKLERSFLVLKTLFRKNVLAIITTSYPKAYRKYAKYKTWEELEKYVEARSSSRETKQKP